ncbi:MAG TPA: DUF5684 domain-containing protein [Desulfuromonadaceae bacterium]|jgi:hypothetical protein
MDVLVRHTLLVLFVWLMLAGVCLGKQVYLKDGGIIDSQSAWQRGDKVFVKINRDIIADFNLNEIDLLRTFPKAKSSSRHLRRKISTRAATVALAPKPVSAPVVPAPVVAPPPKPAAQPAPTSAPVKETLPPAATSTAPAEAAPPPDKAELERRKQEAVKMMTDDVLKKDPELMKKALEMQKSAMPQQGAAMQQKAGIPLYLPLMLLVACLLIIIAQWIIFERAGQAGWKCLIPFYGMYILMEIAGKPGWWMFLLLIPLVGVVILLLSMLALAKKFRRSELFGVGIFLLPMIFFPVLAFGGSEYEG